MRWFRKKKFFANEKFVKVFLGTRPYPPWFTSNDARIIRLIVAKFPNGFE